ncbi:hypothetical protein M0R45_018660 [Rubus argutus]|uniref:Uncharacterized protein n=1 Tax=Rubus argutus TaxID=59490 RepID=A0AAW1X4I4_RUBAR
MGGASRFRARQRARAAKMEAMEADHRNREAIQADRLRNMSLYICTFEDYSDWKNQKLRYQGDLPLHMSFGVFGSRIVMAGGRKSNRGTTEIYVLETDPAVELRPKFIKGPGKQQRKAKPQYAIPKFNGGKSRPFMVEVKGKLSDSSSGSGSPHLVAALVVLVTAAVAAVTVLIIGGSSGSSGSPHTSDSSGGDPDFLCQVFYDIRSFLHQISGLSHLRIQLV